MTSIIGSELICMEFCCPNFQVGFHAYSVWASATFVLSQYVPQLLLRILRMWTSCFCTVLACAKVLGENVRVCAHRHSSSLIVSVVSHENTANPPQKMTHCKYALILLMRILSNLVCAEATTAFFLNESKNKFWRKKLSFLHNWRREISAQEILTLVYL